MQGSAASSAGRSVDCSAADEMARQSLLATGTDGPEPYEASSELIDSAPSLREAAAARVAAHRNRRAGAHAMEAAREEALRLEHAQMERDSRRGVSRVRDAVRARYEHSQSYRDFLAAEAERATQQARAEAEIAARNARAIADAQLQLLEELKQTESLEVHEDPASFQNSVISTGARSAERRDPRISEASASAISSISTGTTHRARHPERALREPINDCHPEAKPKDPRISDRPERHDLALRANEPHTGDLFAEPDITEITTGGLTVRLYDDLGPFVSAPSAISPPYFRAGNAPYGEQAELEELEHEIAFRRAPEFIDHIIETLPLPANLIEFPRELIAARKARPRLAEGPLREDLAPEPQLRIFEVEPETISTEPAAANDITELTSDAPGWQGLLLDTPHLRLSRPQPQTSNTAQLEDIAPIPRRLMAATVDACCIGAALVAFATTVSWISGPRLQALSQSGCRPMLAGAVLVTFAIAALLYQLLFFSLNEATPGMRYARIGLCTFADDNPTRRAMRRRVLATVLAACPLGLGLLWAWMDDDRLGWHDRISRMYHRSY
jgi:uncharacterized RDD family membrane protein YckC